MNLIPREHGAWSMLLQPFLIAAILSRTWHWTLPIALLGIVIVFVVRQPLVILARQRYVWKSVHPETADARRVLAGLSITVLSIGAVLLTRWPLGFLSAMAVGAASMTLLAVGATVRNLQRSLALQIASAIGLTASSLAAPASACGAIPRWTWWVWGAFALLSTSAILVVHARLDARIRLRKPDAADAVPAAAVIAQVLLVLASIQLAVRKDWWLAAAMGLPGLLNSYELLRLTKPESLNLPLKTVGLRAMALSFVVSLLLIAGLWSRSGC